MIPLCSFWCLWGLAPSLSVVVLSSKRYLIATVNKRYSDSVNIGISWAWLAPKDAIYFRTPLVMNAMLPIFFLEIARELTRRQIVISWRRDVFLEYSTCLVTCYIHYFIMTFTILHCIWNHGASCSVTANQLPPLKSLFFKNFAWPKSTEIVYITNSFCKSRKKE